MSELYQLPDGWEWKTIDDLCEILDRLRKPISQKDRIAGKYPYYGATGIVDYINAYIFDQRLLLIGEDGAKWGANENTAFIADGKYWVNNHAHIMKPYKDLVIDSLLVYYLNFTDLMDYITGATVKKLNQEKLKSIKIPLPPLSEQQRIVAKLDALFEKIDKAIALHVKNMEEADGFMASVLNEVFSELEEKYESDNIGNMIDILTDYHSNGSYKILKENVELLDEKEYSLMIRATDLENEDYENSVKYISESAYDFLSKTKVYGGEIILPKIGTIGNVYFMPYLKRPTSLAMNLFMLRCSDNVDNKYLFSYLKSPKGHNDIINRANGATTKTITKDAVRSIELPLPPLPVQQQVVTYLDELSSKIEQVKKVQKEKMESLKALKASILDSAFRGEL